MASEVARWLSAPRLSTFETLTGTNELRDALELYTLNAELSGAFTFPIAMLEVVFRNKCDVILAQSHGVDWLTNGAIHFNPWQAAEIAGGKTSIHSHTFGFWTFMLNKHHNALWNSQLSRVFSFANARLTRKVAAGYMHRIREFRNRIGHHEQILTHDPAETYSLILALLAMMQPEVAQWTERHSSVNDVLRAITRKKRRWKHATF